MEPIDTPSIPWHTISADLFTHQNNRYLLIADYHSKYPIVEKLNDMSSQAVTYLMDKIIGLFGVPNTIITDNGPEFIGQSFQKIIKQHHINHITSSAHYPRSHEFIERMVSLYLSIPGIHKYYDNRMLKGRVVYGECTIASLYKHTKAYSFRDNIARI